MGRSILYRSGPGKGPAQYEEKAYSKHLVRQLQDEKEDPETSQKREQTQVQINGQEKDWRQASERQLWD